jgi:hypothetical protein
MKKGLNITKYRLLPVIFCLLLTGYSGAQVTIGANLDPNEGSLLDLKTSDESVNSTKGMMLPRVRLTDLTKLYPMLEKTPGSGEPVEEYNEAAEIAAMHAAHIGLTVYNVGKSWEPSGIFVWTGAKWIGINGEESTVKPPYYTCEPTYYEPDPTKSVAITVNLPGSGTKTMTFLTYNLGANPNMTVKEQMEYTSGGADDITVFGGVYQWGRKDPEHSFRCSNGSFTDDRYTISGYDPAKDHMFVTGFDMNDPASPLDWITPRKDDMWGNGLVIDSGGNGEIVDGNVIPPGKTGYDPCPDGYRVPTEHEWALLGNEDGSSTSESNDKISSITASGSSGNSSGIVWVPVSEGYAKNDDWGSDGKTRGYALYNSADWTAAAADYRNGSKLLSDAGAPKPLLFLPAGGYRRTYSIGYTGREGTYWSSVVRNDGKTYPCGMNISSNSVRANSSPERAYGVSVRCIAE